MSQIAFSDPALGLLTWNESTSSWECTARLTSGRELEVALNLVDMEISGKESKRAILPLIEGVRLQVAFLIQREGELREELARQVIKGYCEEYGIGPVARDEITRNVEPYMMVIHPNVKTALYYSVRDELDWWQEGDITILLEPDGDLDDVSW